MAGEIRHAWDGSVLTVTSDAGVSSADLRGPKGDTGPRGPQGPGGIVYNEFDEALLDLSDYYTKSEVDELVAEGVGGSVDLSNYYTKLEVNDKVANVELKVDRATADCASKEYVNAEIAKAQMEAADIDTSQFVTRDELDDINLSNYPTKTEVNALIAAAKAQINIGNYYTKSEVNGLLADLDSKITFGTVDLTAGVSSLATGTLYVVYE